MLDKKKRDDYKEAIIVQLIECVFEKNKLIGEVYVHEYFGCRSMVTEPVTERGARRGGKLTFKQFKKADIIDVVGNKIKIFDIWFDKKDIFYYDSIYDSKRNDIKRNVNRFN